MAVPVELSAGPTHGKQRVQEFNGYLTYFYSNSPHSLLPYLVTSEMLNVF